MVDAVMVGNWDLNAEKPKLETLSLFGAEKRK